MDFERIDIRELLPQRDPFIMIDKLIHYDESNVITRTLVSDNNIFVNAGYLQAAGLIENVAQTCAARIGYINKYILKRDVEIGFIGAVRDFEIFRMPSVGEIIITKVEIVEELFGMTLATATIHSGEEIIARSQMKIAVRREE